MIACEYGKCKTNVSPARTKLIHSGPLIILIFCTVTLVAWKSVNKIGLTIESCFALAFEDCSVKAYPIH